jgi:cytochrome c biogenesis protein CcdA
MVTRELLLSIGGLALLDSLNPATIGTVTLILLAAPKRASLIAFSAVIGAAITVFAVGAAIFISAGAAAGAVDTILVGLRFLAFGAAGIYLIYSGIRRLRDRERKGISLPTWFSPKTALPFGVFLTAADLPNAFPYFISIERMVARDVEQNAGLLIIFGYTLIYCLPCLILLLVGTVSRDVTKKWLERLVAKLGTGPIKRSIPIAVVTIVIGICVGSIPFVLLD